MAWKNLKQRSLADTLIVEHATLTELDDVHALLDWSKLEAHLISIHNKAAGEKAWLPLMMFKALLLQSWYKLSDPQLVKQLARDLLFCWIRLRPKRPRPQLAVALPPKVSGWRCNPRKKEQAADMEFVESMPNTRLVINCARLPSRDRHSL